MYVQYCTLYNIDVAVHCMQKNRENLVYNKSIF